MMIGASTLVLVFGVISGTRASAKICVPGLGCMQGTTMPGFQSDPFEAFMGIPFAQPPVGDLRFANPVPAEPWEGVLNVSAPRADCIQKNYLLPTPFVMGEEDCLYLNVYRPVITEKKLLPVMVYIYGGGFFSGTASPLVHGPEFFMDTKEVILVTVAYRLGALGFLSTGDEHMPGNFGLKDQNMALKWVQKYISWFDGDPDSVTIFGQSAGAVSVHMHVLSDLSAGLFQRAIVMSGNAAAPFALLLHNPLDQARQQAEYANIDNAKTMSSAELTASLRQLDAKELVESGDQFHYWNVDPLTTFRPCVEIPLTDAFLTEDPSAIIASGKYTHVPWMTGMVPNEGAVRALGIVANEALRTDFNTQFDHLFDKLMELPPNDDTDVNVAELIEFYFHGVHELNTETAQGFGDSITDRGFVRPFYQSLEHYVETADLEANPVYLYRFNYRGAVSYSMIYTGNTNNYGVVHCDDLIYLFKSPLLFGPDFPPKDSTEAKVVHEMVDNYVTFAITGKPKDSDQMKPCNKENLERDNKVCDYKEIKNQGDSFVVEVNDEFNSSRVKLWDEILN